MIKAVHLLRFVLITAAFSTFHCKANSVSSLPFTDVARQYTQKLLFSLQEKTQPETGAEPSTYQTILATVLSYSSQIELLPTATEFYFDANSRHYDYFSLPMIALPAKALKLELFGQLYDPESYFLTHLNSNDTLYHYQPNKGFDWGHSKLAYGIGSSLALTANTKLRAVYTSGTIPGLGDNKLALSLQAKF